MADHVRMPEKAEYAAYRSEDGQLQLTTSCLLFFDILGTSAMSMAPDAVEHLRRLRPALEAAVERAGTDERFFSQASTWFTDNAVVATPIVNSEVSEPITGGLEVAAAYLLLVCWERGFLGRGAITVGPHYMDERFVFGPALIEAVGLEKQARWPRVVLGAEAVAVEREHSRFYADSLQSAQSRCLSQDEDGVVFVDHLGIYIDEEDDPAALHHYLSGHRQATEKALSSYKKATDPWEKWRWLAEYQNHALRSRLPDPEPYLVQIGDQRHQFKDFLDSGPYTAPGSPWYAMDRHPRVAADPFASDFLTSSPGVYVFYREGARVYVGATSDLLRRVRTEHLSTSASLRNSALRRNVAEHLGIASASDIRSRRVTLTSDELGQITSWLRRCEVGWRETDTEAEAREIAAELKRQQLPSLNTR